MKKLFNLSLESEKPVHILLVGPPASAKTLFMLECMKLERSYFTLGSHSTKSGMIDYLFKNRPKYLIVDEIEHMLTPLLSRFLVLHFKPYKLQNFQEITVHLLEREGISNEIANEVANAVWLRMKSRDIRDCIKIGHLARTKEDVGWIIETIRSYK